MKQPDQVRGAETQIDRSHLARNLAERERLDNLVAQLGDDELARRLDEHWTVSALFAHLAFWDRFVLARWNYAEQQGDLMPPSLDDALQELINAAAIGEWRAIAPRIAAEAALEAAIAIDRKIAELGPAQTGAALASGRLALVDRSQHRGEHLDQIDRALAG